MVDLVNAPLSRTRGPSGASLRPAALSRVLAVAACFWSAAGGAEVLRDPMRPPSMGSMTSWSAPAPTYSGPRLQAIHFSSRDRSATINGRRVRVGDRVGTARVALITRSSVVLQDGGDSKTLKLFPDFGNRILTPASNPRY